MDAETAATSASQASPPEAPSTTEGVLPISSVGAEAGEGVAEAAARMGWRWGDGVGDGRAGDGRVGDGRVSDGRREEKRSGRGARKRAEGGRAKALIAGFGACGGKGSLFATPERMGGKAWRSTREIALTSVRPVRQGG